MANCMGKNCTHMDEKSGKCTFTGTCIVKQYNLNDPESLNMFLNPTAKPASQMPKENKAFNPFQRGNGCMLAGYAHDEILSHKR